MSLFSAIGKYALRQINDAVTRAATKKAQKDAYSDVGRQIRQAKKKKQRIDGSAAYQKSLQRKMRDVRKHDKDRSKFIDDL